MLGLVRSRFWGWTLFPSAELETPFQRHLPNRCVTVRPPHALHTLLVNLGPQSASLVYCFLLLDRQARLVPVCAASWPRISWQLLLWGQDPTGRGSAAQSVKTAAHVHPTFIRGGLLGLGLGQRHVWGATPRVRERERKRERERERESKRPNTPPLIDLTGLLPMVHARARWTTPAAPLQHARTSPPHRQPENSTRTRRGY